MKQTGNKTRNFKVIILLLFLFFNFSISTTNAFSNTIRIVTQEEYDINRGEIFNFYASFFDGMIPESYKYIYLNYLDVEKDSELYSSLQKLVYLDLIKNTETNVYAYKDVNVYKFYKLSEQIFNIEVIKESDDIESLKQTITNINHLDNVEEIINDKKVNFENEYTSNNKNIELKKQIFNDVYSTILNQYYNKDNVCEEDIISGAIEGLAKGAGDKHTVYFPPTETKDFYESLNGEYEGIGSYVELEEPGVFKILNPIKDSPSEKAGLKAGDRVLKVDDNEIKKENSVNEIISWIKGPKGTDVVLTIERNQEVFDITVTRDTIIIKDVEYETFGSKTFYIEIKSFGDNVSTNFNEALEELTSNNKIKKIIIDLRNNGGGYLNQVTDMLSHFIPEGEVTAHVKYLDDSMNYYSEGYETIDLNNYEVIILQNGGTASASEIMIGTIKDYFPDIEIIGEKSYGKGSVQTIKSYSDGSTLKYTVAKWFTGKTQTGIDGVGIEPTIELEFDYERYEKYDEDNQLEKAKNL